MKIYLAGVPGGGWIQREIDLWAQHPNRLWYYHWLLENKEMETIYLAGTTILIEREKNIAIETR